MESPLLTWVIITFAIFFCFFVESQKNVDNVIDEQPQQLSPSPPPPSPSPPSPPPPSPPPPSPPPPSPPPPSPPPPSPPPTPSHLPPPPPPRSPPPPGPPLAPPKNATSAKNHTNDRNPHSAHGKLTPPPSKEEKLNFGKKIGLFFVGIAAILQVCVVAFLVIKRRQLLRAEIRF